MKYILVIIFFLSLFYNVGDAQSFKKNKDSLLQALSVEKEVAKKVELLTI